MDYVDATTNYIGNRNRSISTIYTSSMDADIGVVAICWTNDLRYNHHKI